MTSARPISNFTTSYRTAVLGGFILVVLALLALVWTVLVDLNDRRHSVNAAADLLAELEGRSVPARASGGVRFGPTRVGSPFLEGQTLTIAGAALLQRVAGAVTQVGGSVLSSQVDLEGPKSKSGFISMVASCEVDQPALQQLLYDIESGMPFLFIDQLVVQAPSASEGGRMRVLIGVSGQWKGGQ